LRDRRRSAGAGRGQSRRHPLRHDRRAAHPLPRGHAAGVGGLQVRRARRVGRAARLLDVQDREARDVADPAGAGHGDRERRRAGRAVRRRDPRLLPAEREAHLQGVLVVRRALALAVVLVACVAHATHFRYGHLTWQLVSGTTVEFTLQNVFRRDGNPTVNPCVNPTTNTVIACSGGDGFAAPGDVIRENIGDTRLNFGDGSPTIGSPGNGGLFYLVTSFDPANNWVFGLAIDPAVLPAIDTSIRHTYG